MLTAGDPTTTLSEDLTETIAHIFAMEDATGRFLPPRRISLGHRPQDLFLARRLPLKLCRSLSMLEDRLLL